MKLLLAMVVTFVGVSSFAEAATRGYLYSGRRDAVFFSGLNDEGEPGTGFAIAFALDMGSITSEQYRIMNDCMAKKTTHAIQVVESVTATPVPTGIPGRTTTFHRASYDVACVPAPGFLQVWRRKLGAQ